VKRPNGPIERYRQILAELETKAQNAARRNKPTMWAHYLDMHTGLVEWFSDVALDDGGYAGAALALSSRAELNCPELPPTEAARLWSLGVYARRILAAWGAGIGGRPSLSWLHDRALVERTVHE
jgi:hypothetical protein